MNIMFEELIKSPLFAMFVIIALGFILGRITIRGINLDISAVIFVALIFGHYGVVVPELLSNFGMMIFIFTIGIQAGPGFFSSFREKGLKFIFLAFLIIASSTLVAVVSGYIFGFETSHIVGLLTGALTSTPGLATAKELAGNETGVTYGIAYPFGVIGVILFIKLLPTILRIDLADKSVIASNAISEPQVVEAKVFRVSNKGAFDKSLSDLKIRAMTGAVVSRLSHNGVSIVPQAETILYEGDLIKAVGYKASLDKLSILIGEQVDEQLPLALNTIVKVILISHKAIVNTSIKALYSQYDVVGTITHVRRSGIDLPADPGLQLKLGDKLTVIGPDDAVNELAKIVGNDKYSISDVDLFPIAMGIILGVLFGKLSISFGNSMTFSFGLTGGILLVALLLSAKGKTGPIVWTMSSNANHLLRQLGLLLFLAGVGTSAGQTLVQTFMEYGWVMFLVGALITLIPMVVVAIVGIGVMKINILDMLGVISGGMTSTPGLAAADSMSKCSAASVAYATIYPVAMVFLIIAIQMIVLLY